MLDTTPREWRFRAVPLALFGVPEELVKENLPTLLNFLTPELGVHNLSATVEHKFDCNVIDLQFNATPKDAESVASAFKLALMLERGGECCLYQHATFRWPGVPVPTPGVTTLTE